MNALHSGLDINPRPSGSWNVSFGARWLHSDRHFVGTHEHPERQAENSQVVNDMWTFDTSVTYAVNDRLSFTLSVPYVDNNRRGSLRRPASVDPARPVIGSSITTAEGIGDIRLSANWWLWDPSGHLGAVPAQEPTGKGSKSPVVAATGGGGRRGNIRVSIGIDCPTGDEDARSYRRVYDANAPGETRLDPNPVIVDQSIQPGDGGWGIPIDVFGYYSFNDRLTGYLQGSYLITPEGDNGVPTGRGNNEGIMSIGDTFMARFGLEYNILPRQGISVSLGLRTEGQPAYDLIGSSRDFRRPGMTIAVEPGISYMKNGWSASLLVPLVFYAERFQSVPDKITTSQTGNVRHGDAAFADNYLMFVVGKQF